MAQYLPKIVGFFLNFLSFVSSRLAAKIALKLFSVPRKGHITEVQSAFLETASKETFLYKNNQIMSYKWSGTKETILFIHGWESNAARWVDLIKALIKRDLNIVALDAPAHGNSGSAFFNVLLYAEFITVISQQFKPSMVVAHSMGGMATVFSISKYHIKTFQKIVLLGVPCEYTEVVARYVEMMGYNHIIITELNKLITKRFGISPQSLSTAGNLKNFDGKGLIIHDEEDAIIPYNDALLIKQHFKNSQLISTKGLGHSLKDKSVSSQILEFIDG